MSDGDVEKKSKLKEIQEELIDTYGIEASNIDVVNGKYEEQIGLINELNNKKKEDAQIAFDQNVINKKDELDKVFSSRSFTAGAGKLSNNIFGDGGESLEKWKTAISQTALSAAAAEPFRCR